jgi:hypothetical protein
MLTKINVFLAWTAGIVRWLSGAARRMHSRWARRAGLYSHFIIAVMVNAVISLLVQSGGIANAADSSAVPTWEVLADAIARARAQLTSASLRITGEYWKQGRARPFRVDVHVDGDRWRIDLTRPYRSPVSDQTPPEFTEVSCFGCVAPDRFVFWSNELIKGVDRIAVSVYDPASVPAHEQHPAVDVRLLGMVPEPVLETSTSSLERYWSPTNQEPGSVEIDEIEEGVIHLWRARWRHVRGFDVEFWVSPTQSFAVRRIELTGETFRKLLEVDLQPVDAEEIPWYPAVCRFEYHAGGELQRKEVANIEILSLNQEVPEATWSLASFPGLPAGTTVRNQEEPPTEGNRLIWNGREIVPAQDVPVTAAPLIQRGLSRVLLWLNLGVLCFVAGVYLYRRDRRLRSASCRNDGTSPG